MREIDNDIGDVSQEKVAQFVGMLFLQGMDLLGCRKQVEDDCWFLVNGWAAVASKVNDLTDGEYSARELAQQLRTEYLLRAGLPVDHQVHLHELLVWESIARALFCVCDEGDLTPDNSLNLWAEWLQERLKREDVKV